MRHKDPRHPRLEGYRRLRERYGEGALADALLAKWVTDPDGDHKWADLWADVCAGGRVKRGGPGPTPNPRAEVRQRVVVWHLSYGRSVRAAGLEIGITYEAAKSDLREFRRAHQLTGASEPYVVAYALREGLIP